MTLRNFLLILAFAQCACFLQISGQIISTPVVDLTFQPHPGAKPPIAFQADGKMIVSGDSFLIAGDNQKGIARLNADGSLDTAFAARQGADSSSITSFLIQPDQKILVCGGFSSFSGKAVTGLIRLMPDGTIDPSFN